MYTEQDIRNIDKCIKKQALMLSAYTLVMLCVVVYTIFLWQQLLTMLAVSVYFCGLVFIFDLKLLPYLRYKRFLRDISEGLTREAEGAWLSAGESVVLREGVQAYIVELDEGNEVPRQLYWDSDKPLPNILPGSYVHLETHGSFIKGITMA